MKKLDRKPFLRSMLLVLLFLCSFCLGGVLSPFGVQDGEAYVCPRMKNFPRRWGISAAVRWSIPSTESTMRMAPASIRMRLLEYLYSGRQYPRRHQLHNPAKQCGFSYRSLSGGEEPPFSFEWGGFEWRGVSQDASILIMMAEEEVPSTVSNEPLPILSNLYITLIDGVVWDT